MMRTIRNWLWLVPPLCAAWPGGLAALSLLRGDVGGAAASGLTALTVFLVTGLVWALLTGALKRWLQGAGETLVAMFNFRAGGLVHHMWQVPVALSAVAALFCAWRLNNNAATSVHVYVLLGSVAFLALAIAIFVLHTKWAKPAFVAAGLVAALTGLYLGNYKSHQIELYNEGLAAMDAGDLLAAGKLFDESVNAYQKEAKASQLARLVFPAPNQDLVARALFQKGNILVRMRKPQDAVKAYILSLSVNPGNSFSGLSTPESASRYNDALHTAANLEKLFNTGQSGGQAKGNGRGQGQPQPGPARDRQPQPGAGRQSRDSL